MCPVVTHMNPVRDTNSEPGLPVVLASSLPLFPIRILESNACANTQKLSRSHNDYVKLLRNSSEKTERGINSLRRGTEKKNTHSFFTETKH